MFSIFWTKDSTQEIFHFPLKDFFLTMPLRNPYVFMFQGRPQNMFRENRKLKIPPVASTWSCLSP